MRMQLSIYLLFFVFLASCTEKKKLPSNVLPREKMEAVLWDMLRAGEFTESYIFNRDTSINKVTESEKWFEKIYQLHGITKEQFRQSFAYYKGNLTAFKPILDSLSKKEMEEDVVKDSVSSSSTSPVDSGLLKRKDSLIKIRQSSKLGNELQPK